MSRVCAELPHNVEQLSFWNGSLLATRDADPEGGPENWQQSTAGMVHAVTSLCGMIPIDKLYICWDNGSEAGNCCLTSQLEPAIKSNRT